MWLTNGYSGGIESGIFFVKGYLFIDCMSDCRLLVVSS